MPPKHDIALGWESVGALLDDGLEKLVREHHKLVGEYKAEMPLDPDWEGYRKLELDGLMKILAARRGERLIGYNSFLLLPGHLHYRNTAHVLGDAIFVTKSQWHTGAGAALVERAEIDLTAMFPGRHVRIRYHDKYGQRFLDKMLLKRGYRHSEIILDKMVGGPG